MNMQANGVKVLSIVPYRIFPAQLGGEKGIAVFNEYLAQRVPLSVVTVHSNAPVHAKGYEVLNVLTDKKWRYADLRLVAGVRRILDSRKATHLMIEHPYFGWLAWALKKFRRVTWVVHSHNIEYMRSKSIGRWWWRALKSYEGWVYRRADLVFFISADDRAHALQELGVRADRSMEVTYGIEQATRPADRAACRQIVAARHGIAGDEHILLFNGALYHSTNYEALQVILDQINPLLMRSAGFSYRILVCGRGLPESFGDLRAYVDRRVIYAGFVDDISLYFRAADVFLNPILSGGGVKTKAIEALAMNCSVVSTPLGAMGILREVCGSKLHVVAEGDWQAFAQAVIHCSGSSDDIPDAFYTHYHWPQIIDRVVKRLQIA